MKPETLCEMLLAGEDVEWGNGAYYARLEDDGKVRCCRDGGEMVAVLTSLDKFREFVTQNQDWFRE